MYRTDLVIFSVRKVKRNHKSQVDLGHLPWLQSPHRPGQWWGIQWPVQDVEKVSACSRKTQRLRQAGEAAQAEVEPRRLQREEEFKAEGAAAQGSHGSCGSAAEKGVGRGRLLHLAGQDGVS